MNSWLVRSSHMLFAGWEVRMVKKKCSEVLKMLPFAAGQGKHFQDRGHSFSLYGPTLSRKITLFFFLRYIGSWVGLRNFGIELARVTCRLQYKPS